MNEQLPINVRKGRESYSHAKADARKDKKRQEAKARQRVWDALPLDEKLKRMGKKHRARWNKQQSKLAKKNPAPTPIPVVAAQVPEVKKKKTYQNPKKS